MVFRAIEYHIDVLVTLMPGILDVVPQGFFEGAGEGVTQPVEGLAQRGSPFLVPSGVLPRIAAAVAPPTFDAVATAPGGVLAHTDEVLGRVEFEELAIDGDGGEAATLQEMQSVGQRHLSIAMVMPVTLSIGGDMHELRLLAPSEG